MNEVYKIQTTKDGVSWQTKATFQQGQPSRFGEPFSIEIAKKELESFRHTWHKSDNWISDQKDFFKERLVIEIY